MNLFQRFRSHDAAEKAIGSKIRVDGKTLYCVGHNDLGCLYWHPRRNPGPHAKLWVSEQYDNLAGFPREKGN